MDVIKSIVEVCGYIWPIFLIGGVVLTMWKGIGSMVDRKVEKGLGSKVDIEEFQEMKAENQQCHNEIKQKIAVVQTKVDAIKEVSGQVLQAVLRIEKSNGGAYE